MEHQSGPYLPREIRMSVQVGTDETRIEPFVEQTLLIQRSGCIRRSTKGRNSFRNQSFTGITKPRLRAANKSEGNKSAIARLNKYFRSLESVRSDGGMRKHGFNELMVEKWNSRLETMGH